MVNILGYFKILINSSDTTIIKEQTSYGIPSVTAGCCLLACGCLIKHGKHSGKHQGNGQQQRQHNNQGDHKLWPTKCHRRKACARLWLPEVTMVNILGYIKVLVNSTDTTIIKEQTSYGIPSVTTGCCLLACVVALVAFWVATEVLSWFGFTRSGVRANSCAAKIQSLMGDVPKDGIFARCQSWGRKGVPLPIRLGIVIASFVATLLYGC
ncbi:uncharacterized protein LOC125944101 [Dermacentor silvarum]|uniref:uncharacterized protein LOC125944101 n=1 Tax=Dermacentor silvarum TaxID=543639 RepID=UPI002100E310|nr:uncharacterized protein LOC125944101 [Dermacentor silvarum]